MDQSFGKPGKIESLLLFLKNIPIESEIKMFLKNELRILGKYTAKSFHNLGGKRLFNNL